MRALSLKSLHFLFVLQCWRGPVASGFPNSTNGFQYASSNLPFFSSAFTALNSFLYLPSKTMTELPVVSETGFQSRCALESATPMHTGFDGPAVGNGVGGFTGVLVGVALGVATGAETVGVGLSGGFPQLPSIIQSSMSPHDASRTIRNILTISRIRVLIDFS